jgi:DNA-binding NtrC family response regulator
MQPKVLIVEDDADMANLLAELARAEGFAPQLAHDGRQALAMLDDDTALVLTDLRLPPPDGLTILAHVHDTRPGLPAVMITGLASVDEVIRAFRLGAVDLILKPFDIHEVRRVLARLKIQFDHRLHMEQLSRRLEQVDSPAPAPVTQSRAMQAVMHLAEQVAVTDVPVLLTGETGAGKGTLARYIHSRSPQHAAPFFVLNCAGIAASVAESELFGHEKGAFTGAQQRKRGLLELAEGGTLLLDEINSAPPEIQVRLLQFLQDRTLVRVGGQQTVQVDVRLICATNQPLQPLVNQGLFRADLYYRLNVFPIELPPLRERGADIVPLAERLLADAARRFGRSNAQFTPEALDSLMRYAWPGNVRELENCVQRGLILAADGLINREHLPLEMCHKAGKDSALSILERIGVDANLADVEQAWMSHMLERCGGNKAEAARRLGIDITTLYRKLRS